LSFDPRGFNNLVEKVLPKQLRTLRDQIKKDPPSLETLSKESLLLIRKRFGVNKGDFAGCYVLIKNGSPFYVGISRKVISRLRQHFKGKSHFDASLAYRMAKDKIGQNKFYLTRDEAMRDKTFKNLFIKAKSNLLKAKVVFVKMESAEERYLFEIYAAMQFNTFKWNSFDTH
jgi:predicted GIY-YIG superfamily endonuclease